MADKRLFLALWPDERQRNSLRDVLGPLLSSIEGKAVDRGNWHVTLVFIGQFPEEKIPRLLRRLDRVEVRPFRLRFDRLSYWRRPKIACLEAMAVPEELSALKADLDHVLSGFDIAPEPREYRPHITAMRPARAFATAGLARPLELQWSGFALVESVSFPGGVRYRPLKQRLRRHS